MRGLILPATNAPMGTFLGITYRRTAQDGGHVGLGWREGKDLRVLNQRGHLDLTLDPKPHPRDCVVQLPLPRARIEPTIRFAKRVHKTNGKAIPYNFRIPNAIFDEKTGELLLRRGEGLTCSTFVIAVLEATGIAILKREDWPDRLEDAERHRAIVRDHQEKCLREGDGTLSQDALEHLVWLESQVAAKRFRPEETAASAGVLPLPATFDAASAAAMDLLRAYDAHFKSPEGRAAPDELGRR